MGIDFSCKNCGYLWTSRKTIGMPCVCPSCRSRIFVAYEPASPQPINMGSFDRSFFGMGDWKNLSSPKEKPNLMSLYGTEHDYRRCQRCKHTVAIDDTVCHNCNNKLVVPSPEVETATDKQTAPKDPIICPRCNHRASDDEMLCDMCGYLLDPRL
jgi:hypothetical protein